jgi:hypothetical protein
VFYDVPQPTPTPSGGGGSSSGGSTRPAGAQQLIILTDSVYLGSFTKDRLRLPLEILGGTAPYAVNIDWGDGQSDLLLRDQAGNFTVEHLYEQGGTYIIKISAKDNGGQLATTQTIAIVNGPPQTGKAITGTISRPENLFWELVIAIVIIILVYLAGLATGYKLYREK